MSTISIERAALLGSASALGLNWIYDKALLQTHKQEGHPMIFESIDHDLYKQASTSYDVYPNHRLGDVDFMGEVFYLFFMFLEYEKDIDLKRWRKVFYEYFREDYEYDGYIESYGKAFLQQYEAEKHGQPIQLHTSHVDKQLIGLLFLLGTYSQTKLINKEADALNYAKTLTAYSGINDLTAMLHKLLVLLDGGYDKMAALKDVIMLAPKEYRLALQKALTPIDMDTFIKEYSGIACGLDQSLPLIVYIIAHTNTWKEAMVLNATLGGASSARGIFISAIVSRYADIPAQYHHMLNYQIK